MPHAPSAMSTPNRLSRRAQRAGGQPISDLMHRALAHPELISLAAGFVDQATLPVEPVRQALEALLSDGQRARAALQYGNTPGYLPLREQVLARFREADGFPTAEHELTVDQVILTAGSNQLLHLLCDTLCDPGDIVLCGAPSYFVFLGILGNLGVRSVGVPSDDQGLIPEALEEELARLDVTGDLPRVKAIYVASYYDNPSSITLPVARRQQIVEIARRWSTEGRIHVLEDAAYRELRYSGEDLPSLRAFDPDGETVIVAQTFSKSFAPGVRVGYGILPPSLVGPLCDQKGNIDFGSPHLNQHLMSVVLESGLFDSHVQGLRQSYRVKRDAMLAAADEFLAPLAGVRYGRPAGGLYVWLEVPRHVDTGPTGTLFNRAIEAGVLYVPGEYCYPGEGPAIPRNMIRLSFGVQSPERIRQGIQALARALAEEGCADGRA